MLSQMLYNISNLFINDVYSLIIGQNKQKLSQKDVKTMEFSLELR